MGRLEEAQAALDQALEKDPANVEAIANTVVLTTVSGKDATELLEYVSHNFAIVYFRSTNSLQDFEEGRS